MPLVGQRAVQRMCERGWRANCQCTAQALTLRCCSSDRRESRWWVRDKASTPPLSWGRWHTHAHTPATAGPPVDRRHYPAPLPQWRGLAQDHTVDKMRDMYWWESAVLTWQLPLCITHALTRVDTWIQQSQRDSWGARGAVTHQGTIVKEQGGQLSPGAATTCPACCRADPVLTGQAAKCLHNKP